MGNFMLKLLYKTLLVSVLSGSLLILNMTTAFADSSATAGMSSTGYTRGADGVLTRTETQNYQGTKNDDNNADMISVITGLAVGAVAARLLMYEKWTTDMSIVAVAALAYTAAEIMNILDLKKQIDDMTVQVTTRTDGKVDQTQIDLLQKLRDSYEKVKNAAMNKKNLLEAAAAAYAVAEGVAIWQRFTDDGQYASCEAALIRASGVLDGTCALETEAGTVAPCEACDAGLKAMAASLKANKATEEVTGPSAAKKVEYLKFTATTTGQKGELKLTCTKSASAVTQGGTAMSACETYFASTKVVKAFGSMSIAAASYNPSKANNLEKMLFANSIKIESPKNMTADPNLQLRNLLRKALDVLIPSAEAKSGIMAVLGGATGAIFAVNSKALGETIDSMLFTPGHRMIMWGTAWGLTRMAIVATEEQIAKTEDHIAAIDQTLKDMRTLQAGIKASNVTVQQLSMAGLQAVQSVPLSNDPAFTTGCLTGSSNTNCPSLSNQIANMPGFSGLPSSFQTITSQIANLGNGLSGTNSISSGTMTAAGNIGNQGRAIGNIVDKLKTQLNDSLTKSGKPAINFAAEEKKFLDKLNAKTADALKSKGMTAGSFLASAGLSPFSNANAAVATHPKANPTKAAAGGVPVAAAAASAKEKGFELNLNDAQNAQAALADASGGAKAKEEKYDMNLDDINMNKSESIFKLISNRYMKSGYPRLLDEIPVAK